MTLSISLSPQAEAKLREKAEASGQAVNEYATRLLEQAVSGRTVDEVLSPFRKQVAESGMSDPELDTFFADVRDKAYQDRKRAGA